MIRLPNLLCSCPVACVAFALSNAVAFAQTEWPVPEDGNSDGIIDADEIQRVIDATPAGIIYLPAANVYQLRKPIVLARDNLVLLGEGHGISSAGGTLLQLLGDTPAIVIERCEGSGIRHLSLSANQSVHARR